MPAALYSGLQPRFRARQRDALCDRDALFTKRWLEMAVCADLSAAFATCESLARSHYENFPVGSRLIPARIRPHVCAIYAFARTADDFADEPGLARQDRLDRLGDWEQRLDRCRTRPEGPVFVALAETIRIHRLPMQLLRDLLTAYRIDVTTRRHPDFASLLRYCRFSANPVGRLVLWLFGYRDPIRAGLSDHICTALQLTNFWQDIAIDASRDRFYVPEADGAHFGVTESDLINGRMSGGFRKMMSHQIARTRRFYSAGKPLVGKVNGRLGLELRATWLGGSEILSRIERVDYGVFTRRPTLGIPDALHLLPRLLMP